MINASPRAAWLVSRITGLLAAALVAGFVLATTVAAYAPRQPSTVSNYAFTPKRFVASGAAVVSAPATDDAGPLWPW